MISKLIDAKEKIIPVVCARLAHNCHEVDLNVDYVNGTLTLVKNYKRDEKKEPDLLFWRHLMRFWGCLTMKSRLSLLGG